ncbi:AraC family transcriptional regulator [Gorillibacterium timonense]|uniref:AraC family transcriptional regulator n=1 Tax=Gorillibacterium timonense TaxID=1689269 RepID=UPI00071D0971|nr:AraC family transcriptional regulator [Gorillibacterium timonense]
MSKSLQFRTPISASCSTSPMPISFHSHQEYEIYYFHTGRCSYIIGDQIYELAPGDLILMNGMVLHSPKADPTTLYKRTTVHFHPQYAAKLLGLGFRLPLLRPFENLKNTRLSLSKDEQAIIEPLLGRMCALCRQPDDPWAHDLLLATFLTLLTEMYRFTRQPSRPGGPDMSIKQQNVQRMIAYLEEHYPEELTLEQISAHMRLNKYHLSKIFKEVTGSTLFDYLYQRRINQAKVLFTLNPERPVTEVAYETGFKYPSHFSRYFKAFTGIGPDAYRKAIRDPKAGSSLTGQLQ